MEACDAGHCKKAQRNKPSTTQLPFLDHCHFFWPRRSDKVNPLQIPEVHQCFTKALAPQFGSTTMTWHGYVKDSQGTSGIAWEMTDTKVYSEFSTLCRLRFHVFSPSKKVFPCLVFRHISTMFNHYSGVLVDLDGWGFGRWDHGDIPNQKNPHLQQVLAMAELPRIVFQDGSNQTSGRFWWNPSFIRPCPNFWAPPWHPEINQLISHEKTALNLGVNHFFAVKMIHRTSQIWLIDLLKIPSSPFCASLEDKDLVILYKPIHWEASTWYLDWLRFGWLSRSQQFVDRWLLGRLMMESLANYPQVMRWDRADLSRCCMICM